MSFKILTINENGGDSRSMTAVQTEYSWQMGEKSYPRDDGVPNLGAIEEKLIVKIDVTRNIVLLI